MSFQAIEDVEDCFVPSQDIAVDSDEECFVPIQDAAWEPTECPEKENASSTKPNKKKSPKKKGKRSPKQKAKSDLDVLDEAVKMAEEERRKSGNAPKVEVFKSKKKPVRKQRTIEPKISPAPTNNLRANKTTLDCNHTLEEHDMLRRWNYEHLKREMDSKKIQFASEDELISAAITRQMSNCADVIATAHKAKVRQEIHLEKTVAHSQPSGIPFSDSDQTTMNWLNHCMRDKIYGKSLKQIHECEMQSISEVENVSIWNMMVDKAHQKFSTQRCFEVELDSTVPKSWYQLLLRHHMTHETTKKLNNLIRINAFKKFNPATTPFVLVAVQNEINDFFPVIDFLVPYDQLEALGYVPPLAKCLKPFEGPILCGVLFWSMFRRFNLFGMFFKSKPNEYDYYWLEHDRTDDSVRYAFDSTTSVVAQKVEAKDKVETMKNEDYVREPAHLKIETYMALDKEDAQRKLVESGPLTLQSDHDALVVYYPLGDKHVASIVYRPYLHADQKMAILDHIQNNSPK